MSTAPIYEEVIRLVQREYRGADPAALQHLDIGAGEGFLIRRLHERVPLASRACDFHVERFRVDGVSATRVDLNHESLPYPDATFDLVSCSEVVEHLENYRALIREAYRVLKPGGLFIVTTPNVLSAFSRVRYLTSGFANLFGPLPLKNDKRYSTGGHITPIGYFYLAHSLMDAEFRDVELSVDRVQKISLFWLAAMAPLIGLGWALFVLLETRKFGTITEQNRVHVSRHLSWPLLLGRTIVVSSHKPAVAA